MTFAVGHALTACSYDRKGLEAFWRSTHRGPEVGLEIALSLLESELKLAWYARGSRANRPYRVACIRGLIAGVLSVAARVHHRRPALPVTWGR